MKFFSLTQFPMSFLAALGTACASGVSAIQHLLMRAAVAVSLKLCLFTARVLLSASPSSHGRASQSF